MNDTFKEATPIGKSTRDPLITDERRAKKILDRMAAWFDPPRTPLELPKASDLFQGTRDDKLRHLYAILIARSTVLDGITKIFNRQIAAEIGVSPRQVTNLLKKLEEAGVIAVLRDFYLSKDGRPRSQRIFIVWPSFFISGCKIRSLAWDKMSHSNRIGKERFKHVVKTRIPLKFKIRSPYQLANGLVEPVTVDLDYLHMHGIIDDWLYHKINYYIDLVKEGYHEEVFNVMGQTSNQMSRKTKKAKKGG